MQNLPKPDPDCRQCHGKGIIRRRVYGYTYADDHDLFEGCECVTRQLRAGALQ